MGTEISVKMSMGITWKLWVTILMRNDDAIIGFFCMELEDDPFGPHGSR